MIDNKDIKKIELTFEGHCTIDIEELDSYNFFAEGKVKQWWVKYGTLHMELTDGNIIEEDVTSAVAQAYDNLDTKWPSVIHTEDKKGNWIRRDVP